MKEKKINRAARNNMDGGFEVTMNDGSIECYNRFIGSIVWPHGYLFHNSDLSIVYLIGCSLKFLN